MAPAIMPGSVNGTMDSSSEASANFQAFDHILWYVGNAKQAASYYITRMGFRHIAYVSIMLPLLL